MNCKLIEKTDDKAHGMNNGSARNEERDHHFSFLGFGIDDNRIERNDSKGVQWVVASHP